ncbi:hypothetical protein [Comamonas terrigena]|uniref:hypothetical protein n=1 Tax=Comamonas terrigena TaxID=32013 RepID=UPI00244C5707|nr:hypothetical protein [Comamonas terrigena]MDH1501386.1 hypothetical protein [Comamonas terrigena]
MSNQAAKPSNNSIITALITIAIIIAWNGFGSLSPFVRLSENQSLYIYSSAAQVIAGVYGLTVAGYGFLRSQQDRLIDKDETLIEIVSRIQSIQHIGFVQITIISGLTIIFSLLAIAVREVESTHVRTIALNTASALFMTSLAWTAYFVADALKPEKISKASESIKNEIAESIKKAVPENVAPSEEVDKDKTQRPVSNLELFLRSFNEIERALEAYAVRHLYTPTKNSEKNPGKRLRWTKAKIIDALASQEIINLDFSAELKMLVKYRNALVHGKDLTVPFNMVKEVDDVNEKLQILLDMHDSNYENVSSVSPEAYDWDNSRIGAVTDYNISMMTPEQP